MVRCQKFVGSPNTNDLLAHIGSHDVFGSLFIPVAAGGESNAKRQKRDSRNNESLGRSVGHSNCEYGFLAKDGKQIILVSVPGMN